MTNNTKKNFVILGASFNTNNMGVSALADGALNLIFKDGIYNTATFFDYYRTPLNYRRTYDNHPRDIEFVNIRFSKNIFLNNNIFLLLVLSYAYKLLPIKWLRNTIINKNFYLNILKSADHILSLSGGDSFSDTYGFSRFIYVALPQIVSLNINSNFIQLPQTFGPFSGRLCKYIAKHILNKSKVIFSRDIISIDYLNNLSILNDINSVKLAPDIGFLLKSSKPSQDRLNKIFSHNDYNEPLIGLNISGLLFMAGYNNNNMFNLKSNYKDLVEKITCHILSNLNCRLLLIPHVFGFSSHLESDVNASETVYEHFKHIYGDKIEFARGPFNHREIKHIINYCELFIGSRMHCCIAALSQNIPTLALAYSDKFLGVFDTIKCSHLVSDLRKDDYSQIIKLFDEIFQSRNMLRDELKQKIPSVVEGIYNTIRF